MYNGTVKVKVRFFASLKDAVGTGEMDVNIAEDNATARTVFDRLQEQFPALKRYEPIVLVAVNHEYARWETPLTPDAEVVFFPPVSGGLR